MKIIKEVFSFIGSVSLGLVVALLISIFIFQPTKVLGNSMEPTLKNNNRIYISKLPHTLKYKPHYDDIVIIDSRVNRPRTFKDDIIESPFFKLIYHSEDHIIWVKRVIGKPGDILEFKDNQLYRNNILLKENYIREPMQNLVNRRIIVPKNCIFVMGDNRNYSSDSREIGYIPINHVLGVKLF